MKTPNNINGLRTEQIMQNLLNDVFDGTLPVPQYNKMYRVVYDTLSKISMENMQKSMKEMGINLFSPNQPLKQPKKHSD